MSNESTTQAEPTKEVISESDQTGGPSTAVEISTPTSSPLLSASDILQPLSQMTGIPSSGDVAALAREMKEEQYASGKNPAGTDQGGPQNPASDTNSQLCAAGDHAGVGTAEKAEQNASSVAVSSPSSSTESTARTSTQTNDSDIENQQSIQKQSETVQLVREVDSDGERTFVRRIVEYR
ncbi:hypothetical protein AN0650.2 [Paecilomyces variotii No. 5]|uniref:Uncharacterized protein n=1 Tax=Byssochlamys spectabilis (strain No. 5 / NBRC 109023) TaxID=1356009 RepID=V5G1Y5_BYSSN|nr:hypothetical protein AN0650.2 [Paecilomyces variotii No. 5]